MNRVLALEGVHNFRDYGGYRTRDGAQLKTGLLWRSGQHIDATAQDLDRIDSLALMTVIDLRGDAERARFPCARSPNFAAKLLHSDGETAGAAVDAPHLQASRGTKTVEEAHARMVALNEHMPFRPNLVATFRLYFQALAEGAGPSLLHCVAGKDRTGLAAALLHTLMGVHPDDIMADFMLTNTAGNIERRIAAGAETINHHFGDVPDDVVRALMSVQPFYLETALKAIRTRHGDVERYAEAVLGVDATMRARIADVVLA